MKEYKVVMAQIGTHDLDWPINDLAKEGWKVHSFSFVQTDEYRAATMVTLLERDNEG